MVTRRRAPMGAGKGFVLRGLVFAAGGGCAFAIAQDANPPAAPPSKQSSSSHRSSHHIQVPVEDSSTESPELRLAEGEIEKREYADAELLLRKLVEKDSTSYVAWFDLGFVENALGKVDESIAAYRKSVAAKPDVFESNLNLGLQLAKTGQADAEKFLRAATQLKPTSRVSEGLARAWLSLAHVLEATKPDEALAAYEHAAILQPKDPEPHLAAGLLLERQEKFSDAE